VEYLFQQGEISKGIFRKGSHLKIMDTNGVQCLEADLMDHHSLHEAMEGVDAVFNLISPMPGADTDFLPPNTEGLLNLLEAAAEAKAKTFVHLSTLDVYGFARREVDPSTALNPSNEYQKSKAEAERLLKEFTKRNALPRVTIIRSAKAVGSRDDSLVVPILKMMGSGKVVLPAAGRMSFSHPRDIAQAMFKATTANLAPGREILLKSFDSTPEELGKGIVSAAGSGAAVKKQGMLSGPAVPKYTSDQLKASVLISDQASWKDIGYQPAYDLKSTCEEIANWYRKEPWVAEES